MISLLFSIGKSFRSSSPQQTSNSTFLTRISEFKSSIDNSEFNAMPNIDMNTNYFSNLSFNYAIPVDKFERSDSGLITKKKKAKKQDISRDAKALKNTWKNLKPDLTDEFYNKVVKIAKRINCDPNELMGVMNSESGISHTAVNKKSKATGLIQFMPSTAKELGTTTDKLKAMSPVEQLDYVEKYLKRQKKAAGFSKNMELSAGDLYALVFLPGRAKRSVLTTEGEKYYSWNTGLDRNSDGKITKEELNTRIKEDFMA